MRLERVLIGLVALWAAGAAADPLYNGAPEQLPRLAPDPAAEFRHSAAYVALVTAVRTDLRAAQAHLAAKRPAYNGHVSWFKAEWLTDAATRFVLSAVVYRPDRALARPDTCGEARLIYRLERREDLPGGGALPFMLSLVHDVPRTGDCAAWWLAPEPVAAWAARGWSRVEINLQSSRWSPGSAGGFLDQERYLMRVFARAGAGLQPLPLENTPDVDRVNADPRLRAALVAWVGDNLAAIAAGRAMLPAALSAVRAESVTPLGLARLANRPFSAALAPADLARLPLTNVPGLRTPAGLLRRLDTLSCVGCHQSGSMAGFHVLGVERDGAAPDGIDVRAPVSAYFAAIQPWREDFGRRGGVPPDPERAALGDGVGAPCGLGDAAFAAWDCRTGLRCLARPETAAAVGACMPVGPLADGDPCEHARLTSNWRPDEDVFLELSLAACGGPSSVCASTFNGFPSGLCSTLCDQDGAPNLRCAPVPSLGPFTECREGGGTFAACRARFSSRTGMRRCTTHRDCRPDYVCLTFDAASGICSPPYVAPRLSIEHHP